MAYKLTGKGSRTMSDYPRDIIAAYASGAITKAQFKNRLAAWQKAHGIDYDCKGVARHGFTGVTYRGVNATIRDGVICFITRTYTDESGNRRYIRQQAKSFREFKRKVDIATCDRQRGAAWN